MSISAAQACAIAAAVASAAVGIPTPGDQVCYEACGGRECDLPDSYAPYESAEAGGEGGSPCPEDGGPVTIVCPKFCGH